jgi:hypothetical protein
MKKFILYLVPVLLAAGIFLTIENAFSQENQNGNTADTRNVSAVPDGTATAVKGFTPGRTRSLVGGAVGLISLIVGLRAKKGSANGHPMVRRRAIAAITLGLIGIAFSITHLSASANAALGTGSGKAGAIVGLALSLTGLILGWRALRSGYKTDPKK